MDIGNEFRAGRVSLARFRELLNRRLPFLDHIKIDSVRVVDHLGQNIPVPIMFCSTWKVSFSFSHHVLQITDLGKLEL
jgi:hypothetical protein